MKVILERVDNGEAAIQIIGCDFNTRYQISLNAASFRSPQYYNVGSDQLGRINLTHPVTHKERVYITLNTPDKVKATEEGVAFGEGATFLDYEVP